MTRAEASGRKLTDRDAAIVKGMVARGDRHHDIASWFGVNPARVAEVNNGMLFSDAPIAEVDTLPPPGPYSSGRAAYRAIQALEEAKTALDLAKETVDNALRDIQQGEL